MNQAYQKAPHISKITVEAAGYRWRVYGDPVYRSVFRWSCHLVELLGSQLLDVPVDRDLREKLRKSVLKVTFLKRKTIRKYRYEKPSPPLGFFVANL